MAIPAYYSLIQRGSSGPDVALVQTWLNGLRDACTWHDILKVDGHFGTASEKAVTEFQLRNKLTVDGKVGANTWNAIYAKYTAAHGLHVPYPGIVLRQGSEGGTVRLVQQKLRGEGENQMFACVCGYREKLSAFKERRAKTGAGKRDVASYMAKQKADQPVNTGMADALAKWLENQGTSE